MTSMEAGLAAVVARSGFAFDILVVRGANAMAGSMHAAIAEQSPSLTY
jgi:hypothetical protein